MPKGSVTIDHRRCKVCAICVAVCPVDNLGIEEGRVVAFERCTGCGLCELHCPDFAITAVREDAKSTATKGNGG